MVAVSSPILAQSRSCQRYCIKINGGLGVRGNLRHDIVNPEIQNGFQPPPRCFYGFTDYTGIH